MNGELLREEATTISGSRGMLATAAMMVGCCAAVAMLFAVIPLIGWPAGAIVAIAIGASLVYTHTKAMVHGTHHRQLREVARTKGDRQ